MGKVSKKAPARAAAPEVSEEVRQKVTALLSQGNKLFSKRDYTKAGEVYEQAVKLLPDGAAERVDLHYNRAACFYQLKRFKDAAKECSTALQLAPTSAKVLQRRARSLEQQGLYKQALSDIQAVNRTDAATDETRDAERRLRDAVAGRRPAGLGASLAAPNGAAAAARAVAAAQQQQQQQPQPQPRVPSSVAVKCTLGEETRVVHLTSALSYPQLLELVQSKFPGAGPFLLKYTDRDGDAVTITSRNDVRAALAEVLAATPQPKGGLAPMAPTLKLACAPCGESDMPQPLPDEAAQYQAIKRHQELAAAAAQAAEQQQAGAAAPGAVAQTPSGETVEIDDWLIDFANLFREVSGLDADGHVDANNAGWDATTRAMEATLRSDKATPLFEAAAERFKEVTCSGLLNWGNVSVCIAHKLLDGVAEAGAELDAATTKKAAEAFDKAEERYREALAFHPGYFDGLCALGQLEFERAKLAARLVVKPTPAPPAAAAGEEPDKAAADAAQAAQAAALRAALERVKAKDVEAARPFMAKAEEWYKKAVAAAEAADAKRKAEQEARAAQRKKEGDADADAGKDEGKDEAEAAAAADAAATFAAQARIMEGNVWYEWSQLLAAAGAGWRPALDRAIGLFRAAACSDADVRTALSNHTRAEELDLGPEPAAAEEKA